MLKWCCCVVVDVVVFTVGLHWHDWCKHNSAGQWWGSSNYAVLSAAATPPHPPHCRPETGHPSWPDTTAAGQQLELSETKLKVPASKNCSLW